MLSRRMFTGLLASSVAMLGSIARAGRTKTAFYSGVGKTFTHYDVNVEGATLTLRNSIELPSSIQYAWQHPSRKFLYVSSSSGGPGQAGDNHHLSAFEIDGSTGDVKPNGKPLALRARPIHNSVDRSGKYLLVAYNAPSGVSVHRITPNGAIGDEIPQPQDLHTGIYAHQIRATPSNQSVILVTRGNNATGEKPEDPGSLKVFRFKDGKLSNLSEVQPGNGIGFGPRHLDFHPTKPWVYVAIERQSQLYVYRLLPDGGLSPDPLFVKTTLVDPSKKGISAPGPIYIHPNGKLVYLANRGGWSSSPPPGQEMFEGHSVFSATDSNIAIFDIDGTSGEPSLIQTIDTRGAHPRTFSFDQDAEMLVAGNLVPIALRQDGEVSIIPAGLAVFRMRPDGKLDFVRMYDVDVGKQTQWWTGMIPLG